MNHTVRRSGIHIPNRVRTGGAAIAAALVAGAALAACKPTDPTNPGERHTVRLEWTAPSVDAEGRPLNDLLGYRVHYRSSSPANATGAITMDVGLVTGATVSDVPAGLWYFGVTARDMFGNESALSNQVQIEVGP